MKKITFLFVLFISSLASFSQNLWKKTSENELINSPKSERTHMPSKYSLFTLDLNLFKTKLQNAPLDTSGQQSNIQIEFPNPEGGFDTYLVYEAPVFEKKLSDELPNMKSYVGMGINDKTARIRFSVNNYFGLHTVTYSGLHGSRYIDTYTTDMQNYIVYYKNDLQRKKPFSCEVKSDEKLQFDTTALKSDIQSRASDGLYRVYRLAISCTIEYAAYHVNLANQNAASEAVKKDVVLAAMQVSLVRLNAVYEKDMAIRMNIIASNRDIIFITADNYTNSPAMIDEIQTEVDGIIGAAAYDIGHGFCTTDSGIAQLNSPCGSGKARGITGQANPVGDPFDIDYVAHEMGHQYGATHTQNNNCNRSGATAVEPGSASTIMGYAGICAPNVQSNSDDHFHAVSIAQMSSFVTGGGICSVNTANNNAAPVVNAGLNYTIPNSTPYILKGTATDANNDALTYNWEQIDAQVSTQSPVATATQGPNYRSRPSLVSNERFMPEFASVLNNYLAPFVPTWEVTPSVARTLNFALTVRDNRTPNGGQTGRDDMTVNTAAVGPFLVSTPNTAVNWVAGSNQTVTWDVAGTTANGINTNFVDIYLFTNDGSFTNPILLASKVPNDGSEQVSVPNNMGTNKRIMIRGYNNIFYDISNVNFTISAAPSSFLVSFSGIAETQNKDACQGVNTVYNINYTPLTGFSSSTTFSASGLPPGAIATFSPASLSGAGTVVMTISNTASSPVGTYNVIVTGTAGANTKTASFYFNLFSSNFGAMTLNTPANNATGVATLPTLAWTANPNANSYDVQVSTNNTFTNIISSGNTTATSLTSSALNPNTIYYWRVRPSNTTCGNGTYSSIFSFTTSAVACNTIASLQVPVAISGSGTPTVTSTINVTSGGTISDVNVFTNISHSYVSDLTITITSPAGTVVELVNSECGTDNDINATFDNAGIALACAGTPVISGTVLPSGDLNTLNGQSCVGVWTLTVADAFNIDGGAINNWSLNICANSLPLEVAENAFQQFSLFPNPNNGEFTVKFNTLNSENISIDIHDIRGRQVFNKKYSNSGIFNENLNVNNLQSGMYLVTVTNGSSKITKRIIKK